ncbi:hypothetical protein M501DRAFT_866938 [Patellaria atrata CBS 101060]|uniref:Uncharacterized protein n=1 Tax=Patellaria atrata CBS 101060 TaxID=1346257 RepID=A0A9P4VQE8_9PEZI|nr:hypothetical protein M501DRAFT_866938 [Patellaria atrata CBS 101060]
MAHLHHQHRRNSIPLIDINQGRPKAKANEYGHMILDGSSRNILGDIHHYTSNIGMKMDCQHIVIIVAIIAFVIVLAIVLVALAVTGHLNNKASPALPLTLSQELRQTTPWGSSATTTSSEGISGDPLSSTSIQKSLSSTVSKTLQEMPVRTISSSTITKTLDPESEASLESEPPEPSSHTSQPPMSTSIFGVTAPVMSYSKDGTYSYCTPWSGLACPGMKCNANTCEDPWMCVDGRCCTTSCNRGTTTNLDPRW